MHGDKLRRVYDIRILLFMNVRRRFRVPIRARVIQYWRPKYNRRVHNADVSIEEMRHAEQSTLAAKRANIFAKNLCFFLYKRVF